MKFNELSDCEQEIYIKLAEKFECGTYYWCDRDWSAWGYGTMTQDDFGELQDNDEFVFELAEFLYNSTQKLNK